MKPCAGCAGNASVVTVAGACDGDEMFRVVCDDPRCGNRTNDWYPRSAAVAAWDRRALPDREALALIVWKHSGILEYTLVDAILKAFNQ